MLKKEIYIFSGLGADERAFQNLDLSDYNIHFVEWISVHENETIEDYSRRIISQITHPFPVLIGLSFGGIIAIEVGKQIKTEKIIIIASVKNKKEIPFYYKLIGKLNLHKLLLPKGLKKSNAFTNYFFGAYTTNEKNIMKQILYDTDSSFLKWAINCIVKWDNISVIDNLKHIHGTKDRILPFCYTKPNYKIQDGGHLITLSHAEEIMYILRQEL